MLAPCDIAEFPLEFHDEIVRLKHEATRRGALVSKELEGIVRRLPRNYRTVGARLYNPAKPLWKLQLAWRLQLLLAAFLVLFFFATLTTYWDHIEQQGVSGFVNAYLIQTLLIQAFAFEFREIFSYAAWPLLSREFLRLVCCLYCIPPQQEVAAKRAALKRTATM